MSFSPVIASKNITEKYYRYLKTAFKMGEPYKKEFESLIDSGDSFASGLVYGLMATGDPELAVNYGAAHGALAMTTPGDTTMANKKEVEAIMGGAGARVQR